MRSRIYLLLLLDRSVESENLTERNCFTFISQREAAKLGEVLELFGTDSLGERKVSDDNGLFLNEFGELLDGFSGLWVELIKKSDNANFFCGSVHVQYTFITSSENVLQKVRLISSSGSPLSLKVEGLPTGKPNLW